MYRTFEQLLAQQKPEVVKAAREKADAMLIEIKTKKTRGINSPNCIAK